MKNLYIQTAFLGDLLLSLPTIRLIRYWDPKSTLKLVCRKGYGAFIQRLNICDEVYELDKKNQGQAISDLAKEKYNSIFCPHQSFSSHRLVSQLKATKKIGYQKIWNQAYFDHRVNRYLGWPEVMRQMQLLALVDDNTDLRLESFAQNPGQIPTWAQMTLTHTPWTESEKQKLFEQKILEIKLNQSYVCFAPGSVWPTKRWHGDGFKQLGLKLIRMGHKILLLGAPDEKDLCQHLQEQLPGSVNLAGRLDIFESLMVLSESKGLVCNDSGAMHLASLINLPTVAIFGPTVQQLGYKPWNTKAQVVENQRLLCRPCGQHGSKKCPIGTHICMQSIDHKQVFEACSVFFR
jgi:heptosyltransferase II